MNVSIKNTSKQSKPSSRAWPFLGAGALALALIIGTSVVALSGRTSVRAPEVTALQPGGANDAAAQNILPSPLSVKPILTYYLVDSQFEAAEAAELEAEADVVNQDSPGAPARNYQVLDVSNPDDGVGAALNIATTSSELEEAGTWDFEVVDLRGQN